VLLTLVTVLTHSLNFAKHGKAVAATAANAAASVAPKVTTSVGTRTFSTFRGRPDAMRLAVDAALKKFPTPRK
jgi:hypothetical protein